MFTSAPSLHRPAAPQQSRSAMRPSFTPVAHDRWGEEASTQTPGAAPLVVTQVLTGTGESATLTAPGCGAVAVQLAGQWRGRVCFETSNDGATWRPLAFAAYGTGVRTFAATKPGLWYTSGADAGRYVRVSVAALTTGMVVGCLAAVSASADMAARSAAPAMRRDSPPRQGDTPMRPFMR